MRRFEIYIDHGVAGMDPITEILEFPSNATEAQIEADCAACLETMISNELDSGWNEIGLATAETRAGLGLPKAK